MSFDMLPGDCRVEILKWSRLLSMTSGKNGWKITTTGFSWWRWYRTEEGKFKGTHFLDVTDWERDMMYRYHHLDRVTGRGVWDFSTPLPFYGPPPRVESYYTEPGTL